MLVEDLIRALPVGQKVYILNAGENVYSGIAYSIPENCLIMRQKQSGLIRKMIAYTFQFIKERR